MLMIDYCQPPPCILCVCTFVNVYCVDGHEVDVQYSNWRNSYPRVNAPSDDCVVVTQTNEWLPFSCDTPQKYVCQSE